MERNFTVVIEKDEDGWFVSSVVQLPGCHTQGKSIEQLMERTKEAIQLYLESKDGKEIKEEFVGLQQIKIEV